MTPAPSSATSRSICRTHCGTAEYLSLNHACAVAFGRVEAARA
jgi:hypothetical protein